MLGSIYTNKSRFELNMSTLKETVNKQISDSFSQKPQYASNVHSAIPKRSFSGVKTDLYSRNQESDDES